jgi:hypothetical protein
MGTWLCSRPTCMCGVQAAVAAVGTISGYHSVNETKGSAFAGNPLPPNSCLS